MTLAPKASTSWLQLLLALFLALAAAVASYSSTKTTTDQHEKRITILEQETVKTREMDQVYKKLDTIEGKIDKLGKR